MALSSFTLRKQTVGYGSFVRKADGLDNSLRADNLTTTAITSQGQSTFSANLLNATTVRLEWALETVLVLESTLVGASAFSPVELVIVSSSQGEPVTITDGQIIQRITSVNNINYVDDTANVASGRWIYYALFTRYSDGTDYWYERSASLYIQIPTQYESVDNMWRRVPEYYRSLDYEQPVLESGYTPLYSFLELFGNEVDRTRSLIDSIAISNDPQLAVTPALSQLAYETGLEIGIDDLGTTKARSLLNNIGSLRQRKGTIGSIVSYISGMTGCGASYEKTVSSNIFHVNAQRINFVSDPRFETTYNVSQTLSLTGGKVRYVYFNTVWGVVTTSSSAPTAGYSAITVSNVDDGIVVSVPANWGSATHSVLVYPRNAFPYVTTETYYCSFDTSASAGASFSGVHVNAYSNMQDLETGNTEVVSFSDSSWNNVSTMPQNTSQRRVFEYGPQDGTVYSVTSSQVPVLEFTLTAGQSVYVGKWLWEPGFNGGYFDGDTRDGGYIPSTSGTSGEGVFDYFWGDGGNNADFSYYLMDRGRTISTTERVLDNYVVPVTMLGAYSVDWNYYPGKT